MAHKFLPNNRKLLDYKGKSICSVKDKGLKIPLLCVVLSILCPDKWLSLHEIPFAPGIFIAIKKGGEQKWRTWLALLWGASLIGKR
jgi:hypothetical protein